MNARDRISPALLPDLTARSRAQTVLLTQQCRQLHRRLTDQGLKAEPIPIVGAIALDATARGIARLSTRKDIGYIEKNHTVVTLMDRARETVGLSAGRCAACDSCLSGRGVTLAIIDTGIAPHRDFHGRIKAFKDLINEKDEPYDDNGHGTMCAGCAAGSGLESGGRYAGVAPEADLVIVKAMDENGGGTLLHVLRAMQWLSDHRVEYNIRIASLSLGVEYGYDRDLLCRAADALWTQGIFVVAAAGNSGPAEGSINSPGRAASVMTVAAMDDRGNDYFVPDFSSRGPVKDAKKPDICAPGVELMTTERTGYALFTGTSAATPVVAGCAALLLQKHPDWTPDRVKAYLLENASELAQQSSDAQGRGVVQAEQC